ncbi:MAG: hypothetical protein DMF49_10130, partial [Acidobacteria bacterium]
RHGMRTVVLPRENEKDLSEIPEDIQKVLEFKLVDTMDEVLAIALDREPVQPGKLKEDGLAGTLQEPSPDEPVTH